MTLQEIAQAVGTYPVEAYEFVYRGLSLAVQQVHGPDAANREDANLHVTGQQLCNAMRDLALQEWGLLARTVLKRWNINSTFDFGKIVYALIEYGAMQKTDQDSIEDFRDVYDFSTAFESEYRINIRI